MVLLLEKMSLKLEEHNTLEVKLIRNFMLVSNTQLNKDQVVVFQNEFTPLQIKIPKS